MSDPVFPPEIVDYILDLLHNETETLKQCCLVSKSWVPRSRKYLFDFIYFYSYRWLESWNNTFPDHTNSPASHVRTLAIDCFPRDVEGPDCIRTFSSVVQLTLFGHPTLPFALFHGLSHNLKSLSVRCKQFSCLELFDFICSFPLLENLNLVGEEVLEDYGNDSHRLQTSPLLTGSLKLIMSRGMGSAPRYLLSLPDGLRFREMVFLLGQATDLWWIRELLSKCSDTLESLDVKYKWFGAPPDPIDLSKATKLKVLIFRLTSLEARQVIAMLETITPEHRDLRQISIHLPFKRIPQGAGQFRLYLGDDVYERWLEVDRLLIQFWESRSIRPKVVITEGFHEMMKDQIGCLFPEIMARGIVDLAVE